LVVTEDTKLRRQLLLQIEARRNDIEAFCHEMRPRRNRLTNVSIISSAVAAIFTAGPAIGGQTFTEAVQHGFELSGSAIVWRVLCFGALIVSLVAVISTNLSKSQDLAARISAAEACYAELEGLETFLKFGELSVQEAAELYKQYVVKIPFVEESPAGPQPSKKVT
jgi:hypothetical protein